MSGTKERHRERLEAERERLADLLQDRSEDAGLDESQQESVSALSSVDQHPADLATNTFERTKELSIADQLRREIEEVDRAVERLEDGSYGRCEACGEAIGDERLEARPAARTCAEHARDAEEGRDHGDGKNAKEAEEA